VNNFILILYYQRNNRELPHNVLCRYYVMCPHLPVCSPQVGQALQEILYLGSQVLLLIHHLGTGGDEDAVKKKKKKITCVCVCVCVCFHVRWVPCHHGMVCPQVVDGGKASRYEGKL
jgi:hypothetical protein